MSISVFFILPVAFLLSSALEPLEELAEGNHNFTVDIYKNLAKSVKDNIIVCPISAQIVLSLLAEGARGPTQDEIVTGVRLVFDESRRQQGYRSLIPSLNKSSANLKLLSANKLYVANRFKLNSTYRNLAVDLYSAAIEKVAFSDNVRTANIINKWVEDHTNNKIQNLIDSEQLDDSTKLVLVNAMYFSGKWDKPFESAQTQKGHFYTSGNKRKEIDMMNAVLRVKFRHCGYLRAKFLELSFMESNVSMIIILPDARNGLEALESRLEEYLEPHQTRYEQVAISLPKFTIQTTIDFKSILKALGVNKVFDPVQSNLSGITAGQPLNVDFVKQKAYINVTETGTEAAAATAVGLVGGSMPVSPKITFIADHPFFFYIQERTSAVILFAGRFRI